MKYLIPLLTLTLTTLRAETLDLWIGTGGGNAEGIYRVEFDSASGKLGEPVLAAEIASPGFLTLTPDGKFLYAVCSVEKGSVAAFAIGEDHTLTLLNTQPIGDGGAAHLSLDKESRILFTAQYGGGSTAAFPLNEDGSIGPRSTLMEHTGSGPNPDRQKAPHPHWTGVSPDNRFLFVPDLGADQVVIYEINHEEATLIPHGIGKGAPGGGPRHMKFSNDGSKIYLLNELLMSVTVFDYEADSGTMTPVQTIASLPEEMLEIPNKASEIRVHPTGKFVYAANRGHDSIAVFSVEETGLLEFVELEAVRGAYPRNFNVSPDGKWLIAAGRTSNTLSIFEIDQETGGLLFTANVVNCPSPICLEWDPPQPH